MTTENSVFNEVSIDEIIEAQQNLNRLKLEKREAALAQIRRLTELFEFSSEDVFSSNTRNISALCKGILSKNPAMSRKDFMSWAKENDISATTAGTQYWKITREIAKIKRLESAVVANLTDVTLVDN